MTDTIAQRVQELAIYIIESGATVRVAAKHFHISKSTVHKDVHERLLKINRDLYKRCNSYELYMS